MNQGVVEGVLAAYRPTTSFSQVPVSQEIIINLIEQVKKVPTQFNLQPAHYWIITDPEQKKRLWKACLKNQHVLDASALIVFSASRYVASENKEVVIDQELECGNITVSQAEALESGIKMSFDTAPCGLGWLGKLIATPLMRLFTAMPQLACIHKKQWLTSQVMRNATLFWYAANEAGLAAEFVDMYDEWRIKLELAMPWHHVVVSACVVGYAEQRGPKKTELDTEELLHCS